MESFLIYLKYIVDYRCDCSSAWSYTRFLHPRPSKHSHFPLYTPSSIPEFPVHLSWRIFFICMTWQLIDWADIQTAPQNETKPHDWTSALDEPFHDIFPRFGGMYLGLNYLAIYRRDAVALIAAPTAQAAGWVTSRASRTVLSPSSISMWTFMYRCISNCRYRRFVTTHILYIKTNIDTGRISWCMYLR